MKDKLVIIGASGHGKVIADIAKLKGYNEIVFLDDDLSKSKNGSYDVLGTINNIDNYIRDCDFIVAIGNNAIRKSISERLILKNIEQTILVHPSAVVDSSVVLSQGTVVMANAVINADSKIGRSCIINTASTIDHDCIIHDYVHLSPGSHVAGTVSIGEECWLGIGSIICNNIDITDNCTLGAGSVVINDIQKKGTYVGCPAKKVK